VGKKDFYHEAHERNQEIKERKQNYKTTQITTLSSLFFLDHLALWLSNGPQSKMR